jgi:hypothetical protein
MQGSGLGEWNSPVGFFAIKEVPRQVMSAPLSLSLFLLYLFISLFSLY